MKTLVRLRGGVVETVKISSAPLTWRDHLKVYYLKMIAVLSELLAVGNLMTPAFNYLPSHEKHYVTIGLVLLGTALTVLNREKAWVEGL